jgi:cell division protein FtsI (penicillin-binding protein 3)
MKQFFYVLLLINLTAQAQGFQESPQSFSDKILLAKLKSEQADNGLAVVMDLSTNKIVSVSAFVRKGNLYNKDSSLLFRPIEPGSLMLPISAAILIDNFGVSLEDSVDLEGGKTKFGGLVVQDGEMHGMRNTSILTVIAESSNVGLAKLVNTRVEGMQPSKEFKSRVQEYFSDMAPPNFGFDAKTSLPFWAFGYGLTLSPNQIFSFYCRVANKDNTLFKHSNTFNQIQTALLEVCKNGTAKRLFFDAKYNVAGKTGTSLAANKNGYANAQYQASFIGYTPAENPKYACMVIIKCQKHAANHYGASVAGPVFKAIIENLKD